MLGLILLTTIFSLIFAVIFYGIGYYGGSRVLEKYKNKSVRLKKRNSVFDEIFNKGNEMSLFMIRLIPFSRTYISILSGVYKQEFYTYLFISFVGIFIWNSIFVSLGFTLFINFEYISYFYDNAKTLILMLFSASIIVIFLFKIGCKKR